MTSVAGSERSERAARVMMTMRGWLALCLTVTACANAGQEVADARPVDARPPDAVVYDAPPPDAGPPDATPCGLVPQSGCGAQQACDLDPAHYASGGTICRAAGSGKETKVCTAADCAAGYTCFVSNDLNFSCAAFCGSDAQCTAPGGLCVQQVTFNDGFDTHHPVPGGKVCSTSCDPLLATGCPPLWSCQVYVEPSPGTRGYTMCTQSGAGTQDVACARAEDCQQGFACGPGSVCLKRCLVGQPNQCTGIMGVACTALSSHPTVGGKEYGVCHQ